MDRITQRTVIIVVVGMLASWVASLWIIEGNMLAAFQASLALNSTRVHANPETLSRE